MKVQQVIFITLFSGLAMAHEQFDGVWQLLRGEYRDESGKIVDYQLQSLRSQKIIHQGHYSFITLSGDKFWSAGNGTLQFDQSHYTEQSDMTSYGAAPGTRYTFNYELHDDQWTMSRYDQNGQRVEWEVWQRVKP